jgi:hypothetical protein
MMILIGITLTILAILYRKHKDSKPVIKTDPTPIKPMGEPTQTEKNSGLILGVISFFMIALIVAF